ncbi:MAG: DEAD/DEAH box helicase, partial [Lachnospiraceae bacterium]|nr:DEAD/DEAH box helicase [Lachnospiraceae bacterium]
MRYQPRPYQQLIIDKIINTPRCAIFAGMGMGKTSSTLFAIDFLRMLGEVNKVLVLAPLRVAQTTWPDEVRKWRGDLSLRISAVVGSKAQRMAALRRAADVYTINYESIGWLVETLKGRWPFDMIVADESTKLKSFRLRGGGVRARALASVAINGSARFVELTGTPSPNGLLDLWGQLYFLDCGERLGRTYTAYTHMYFDQRRVGSSPFAVQYVPYDWTQERIQAKIRDLCLSLQPEDYFDLEEPIISNIEVELPPAARKVYDTLMSQMLVELDSGEEITAANAAALTVKCLQAANGALYSEDGSGSYTELHSAKLDALRSIVSEANGAPVLVAYHFRSDCERILREFPEARVLDRDPRVITDWNAGKIPLLLAHPASAGHGLNLQDGGHILVMFAHWWNLEQYQQIVERIGPVRQLQSGHPRSVFI